tara:strand:+ start:122 stop:808 length:687 start_codon:yes stop_codon:yes gene_type:complete
MGTIRKGYEKEMELQENIFNTTDMFSVLHYYREFKTENPQLPSLLRRNSWDEIPEEVFEELDEIIDSVLKDEDSMKRVDIHNRSWEGGPDLAFLLEDEMLAKALKFVSREVYLREGSGEYDRTEAGHMAKEYLPRAIEIFDSFIHKCLGTALSQVFSRAKNHELTLTEAWVLEPKIIEISDNDARDRATARMFGQYVPEFEFTVTYSAVDKSKLNKDAKKSRTDSMFG